MKKRYRIISAAIAAVMILALLLSLFPSLFSASAVTQKEIDAMKEKISGLTAQKDNIEKELTALKKDKKQQLEIKERLDSQIEVAQNEISAVNELIDAYTQQIEDKEVELSDAQQAERDQYALFKRRMRAMYEAGDISYLGILLEADDISDFLSRMEIVSQVLEYDKSLTEKLAAIRDEIAEIKASLETQKQEQLELKVSLEDKKASLEKKLAESETYIASLEQDEEEYKKAYAEYEEEEERLQAQVKKMVAELASQSAYVGGTFLWPAPGYYTITSPFGMRYHPVLKVNKLHTGVDISAPKGASIVAANTGTVITSTYSKAWGNYVVINHGGGKATLYAHMSKRLVSKGDKVTKGDKIGLVGATGYATGNHLHFEVIIDGTSVDPMQFFSKS